MKSALHPNHADLARLELEIEAIAHAANAAQNECEFWRLCRTCFSKMEEFWDCSTFLMRNRHAQQ